MDNSVLTETKLEEMRALMATGIPFKASEFCSEYIEQDGAMVPAMFKISGFGATPFVLLHPKTLSRILHRLEEIPADSSSSSEIRKAELGRYTPKEGAPAVDWRSEGLPIDARSFAEWNGETLSPEPQRPQQTSAPGESNPQPSAESKFRD